MPTAFLDHPGPLAFAHRGGAAHAPENSWRAFEHAVGLGYEYLETDAQATADGVLLAFHDRTLGRTTGQPGRVSRLTLKDIARARVGSTERIPILEEGVALAREVGDSWVLATALWQLAMNVNRFLGDQDRAEALARESAALFRQVGDRWGVSGPLGLLGWIAEGRGDSPTAIAMHEEALALQREVGDPSFVVGLGARLEQLGLGADRGDLVPVRKTLGQAHRRASLTSRPLRRFWLEPMAHPSSFPK